MKKVLFVLLALATFTFALAVASPKNTYAAVGCGFDPKSVAVGGSIGIIVTDLPGINVAKLYTYGGSPITLGNINGGTGGAGGNTFTIPSSATAPEYQVRVQTSFGGEITCAGGNLTITSSAPPASCTITPASGAAGDTINISSTMSGTINVQPSGGGAVTAVGWIMGSGPPYTSSFQIPTTLTAQTYKIGVASGIYAVFCNDLTVIAPGGGGPNNLRVAVAGRNVTFTFDPSDGSFVVIADLVANCPDFMGIPRKYDSGQLAPGTTTAEFTNAPAGVYCAKIVKALSGETLSSLQYFEVLTDAVTGRAGCEGGFLACMASIQSPTTAFSETGLIGAIFTSILPIIIGLGGFLTIIIIVISGIQFVTSSGNPEAAAAARGRLTFAIIGFALLVLAFAITQIIDNIFLRGSGAI